MKMDKVLKTVWRTQKKVSKQEERVVSLFTPNCSNACNNEGMLGFNPYGKRKIL